MFKNFGVDVDFLYRSLIESSSDYIYILDVEEGITLVSPNMVEDFGLPGTLLNDFFPLWMRRVHGRDRMRIETALEELLRSDELSYSLEYQVQMATGKYLWVAGKGYLKRDPQTGKPLILVGMFHNMELEGKVDPITGLFGYAKCKEYLEQLLDMRPQVTVSLLLIGIDDFARINTLNNHKFGDSVLRVAVQDIQSILPEHVSIYRFDGDRFMLVGTDIRKAEMLSVYNEIKAYTMNPHEIQGQTYRFTVSGGLVQYPEDGAVWSDLEKGASITLKKAKENGKNQCIAFTKELYEEKIYEQSMSKFLADSVGDSFKGFWVVFQPVCLAGSLEVKGAEALLRFDTPDYRTISSLEFIPLLESSHLIIPVGIWVLEQAIAACKKWTEYIPDFVMNVNVSYIQLRDPLFCKEVEALLEKYKLETKNLTLELTESYFITDAPNINDSLERLQELHLQLAMDDFGTGYSSLAQLAKFNVDVIKIDKLFVQSLNKSKYNHDFIESVVRLCHNVGMKVCVEGVETEEEQKSITLLNVDYVQGFYVSRPVNKTAFFETFIKQKFDSEKLVVLLDKESRQRQMVGDKELLLAMMDATPMGLNLWSRDLEILACNEEILKLFRLRNLDEFKENFYSFSPEYQPDGISSKEMVKKSILEAFEMGRKVLLWMHCDRDGSPIPTEVTLVRIPYHTDYIVVSYTRDLRSQLQIEWA